MKVTQNGPLSIFSRRIWTLASRKKVGSNSEPSQPSRWAERDFLRKGGATAWVSRWLFIKKSSRTIHSPRRRGCGDRTWTCDLRVMSPTSYQLLYPAIYWYSLCDFYSLSQFWFHVKRFFHISFVLSRYFTGTKIGFHRRNGVIRKSLSFFN